MADCYSKETRSKVMSKIKAKNTRPEIIFRKELWKRGYRGYRIHCKYLPGKPDIAYTKYKIAIFIDGCFWHKCPECFVEPKSNRDYWLPKIERTVERDRQADLELKDMGWTVIRIWEHDIKKSLEQSIESTIEAINTKKCTIYCKKERILVTEDGH